MQIRDLIAALEAAAGPDEALDIEIMRAIGRNDRVMIDPYDGGTFMPSPARYTGSMDAAVTLAPEDHYAWSMSFAFNGGPYQVTILTGGGQNGLHPIEHLGVSAAKPEIAFCIAALKARQKGDKE